MSEHASATSTVAGTEEPKPQPSGTHTPEEGQPPYDPNFPDPSFPFQSTNIEEGGFTNEYRTVSRTGFIPASTALRPIPSNKSVRPTALQDPEKAQRLKDIKLVTFVPDDPENPLNYSKWYKWCM